MSARTSIALFAPLAIVFSLSCASTGSGGPYEERAAVAQRAVASLQASEFAAAEEQAAQVLETDATNPDAHTVLAITRYKRAMHDLTTDIFTLVAGMLATEFLGFGGFNERYAFWALTDADRRLAEVDRHLEIAAREPKVALELCLACWRNDWNRDSVIDERDIRMLQLEVDANGEQYPDNDSRRTPTFRLDVGDVHWARAMIGFQRAAIAAFVAYDYAEVSRMFRGARRATGEPFRITIALKDAASIAKARSLTLSAVASADAARVAYLAETDDDREWVPNPTQKSHPLPLPVDQALFDTWEGVLSDMNALLRGTEGLSVEELAQLGDDQWQDPPKGYIHVARMFEQPGDIVIDEANMKAAESYRRDKGDVEKVLNDVLGNKYVPQMKASKLISRFSRMKGELMRGEDTFERKLRYLFWLN